MPKIAKKWIAALKREERHPLEVLADITGVRIRNKETFFNLTKLPTCYIELIASWVNIQKLPAKTIAEKLEKAYEAIQFQEEYRRKLNEKNTDY